MEKPSLFPVKVIFPPSLNAREFGFGLLSSHIVDEGKQLEMEDESRLQDSFGFLGVAPLIPSTVPLHFLRALSTNCIFYRKQLGLYRHDSRLTGEPRRRRHSTVHLSTNNLSTIHSSLSTIHAYTYTGRGWVSALNGHKTAAKTSRAISR